MRKKMLTYGDFREGLEAAKHYGLTQRETEQAVREHLDGANAKERREAYQEFYQQRK